MMKHRVFRSLLSIMLLLSLFSPALSFGENSEQITTSDSMIESTSDLADLTDAESSSEVVADTEDSEEGYSTEEPQEQETVEESSEEEAVPNDIQLEGVRSPGSLNDRVEVTEWGIYDNSDTRLSTSNPANSDQGYIFKFKWEISDASTIRIQPNDYFTLTLPQNEGTLPDKSDASGSWVALNSTATTPIMTELADGSVAKIGEWYVEGTPESNYTIQQIRVQFTNEVGKVIDISGEFNLGHGGLKNYTLKAGIQNVAFGNSTQQIYFNARQLDPSSGHSYKNAENSGNNSIKYSLPINLSAPVELGGDMIRERDNGIGTYWGVDPVNPDHDWGEYATDALGIFMEDELESGATLGNITITAETRIPILFPFTEQQPYDGSKHRGGITASDSAYLSYVLFDTGRGPEYRTSPTSEMWQKPTQETSFDRVYQESGESKTAFRERVKARDYQYGAYYDEQAKQYTLMVYFGDISRADNEQYKLKKYSDLTDQKYASSGRMVKGTNIPVLNFAVKSADHLIKNGYYSEKDRELLEDYYTLTFGESNVFGGQISTYNVSFNVNYPPETASGEKSNTGIFDQSNDRVLPWEGRRHERSATSWLSNPYSSIQLQSNQAAVLKFDENNRPMNGVKFGLQKKTEGNWEDVEVEYATGPINVPVKVVDSEGHPVVEMQTLEGGSVTGALVDGTYRFVELETPAGYDKMRSPNFDETVNQVVSEEFLIPAAGNGSTRYVRNVSAPSYTVFHYVQKEGAGTSSPADFELKYQETKHGETNSEVIAQDRKLSGYSYLAGHPLEVKQGTVNADGSLVLALYYQIDKSVAAFSIDKLDNAQHSPMPSYDIRGDPLGPEKTVMFDIYFYNGEWDEAHIRGTHPENDPNHYWERLVIDGEPVTVTTDAEGRIQDSRVDLVKSRTDTGEVQYLHTFALVEKQTYKEYELPDRNSGTKNTYWIVFTQETANNLDAQISHVAGVDLSGELEEWQLSGKVNDRFAIFNRKDTNYWWLYKEDMSGKRLPSYDENGNSLPEKVSFQLYKYDDPTWTYAPGDYSPADDRAWAIMEGFTYTTNEDGRIVGEHDLPVSGGPYALVETSTYSNYHCPNPRQAYWILWDGGGLSSHGTNNPGANYISKGSYALRNETATKTALYKADKNTKYAMPSNDRQQVVFKYYKFVGDWNAGETPNNSTDLTNTTRWLPLINPDFEVTDPSEEKFLFKTDDQGRLTKINDLFVGGPWGETYAIQEVQTYDGYRMNREDYWIVYVKHQTIGDDATPFVVDGMDRVPWTYSFMAPLDLGNPFKEFVLLNESYQYPTLRFTKENEKNEPLGNVQFELYAGKSDGNWAQDSKDPNAPETFWDLSQPYRTATSSFSGAVLLERLEPGRYLLIETKTAKGYQLPQGEWLITVEENNNEIKITDIRARDGTSPPAFRVDNGAYYLPNYRKHVLPKAGGYMRLIVVAVGIVLLGVGAIVSQNDKKKKR